MSSHLAFISEIRSTAIGFVLQEQSGGLGLLQTRLGRTREFLKRALLLVFFAGFSATLAQAAQYSVEAVKAAYLFRFAQYVEWPEAPADVPSSSPSCADEVACTERLLPGRPSRSAYCRASRDAYGDLDASDPVHRRERIRAATRASSRAFESPSRGDGNRERNRRRRRHQFIEVDRNLRFEIH